LSKSSLTNDEWLKNFSNGFIFINMVKLTHISDTHGFHNKIKLNGGDILIHSGDIVDYCGLISDEETIDWLSKTPYEYKLIVLGNHDISLSNITLPKNVIILNNETIELFGIKFYGYGVSLIEPYSIHNFNQLSEDKINFINFSHDILITHGPPKGIFDNKLGFGIGSTNLLQFVKTNKPKYHLYGHAHHWKGSYYDGNTTFCNSSIVYNLRMKSITGTPLDLLF
jgi:Icc-related predicted phosphoesterase